MHEQLAATIHRAMQNLGSLPDERRALLDEAGAYVARRHESQQPALLHFICTHNSRRSQLGQLWATAAAHHFGISDVETFSGGTEVTAFHPNAVDAVARAGFRVEKGAGENPHHAVTFASDAPAIECFSKTYDDPVNPQTGFAALMTCAEADEACPVVFGAELRVPLRYEDPKVSDGTGDEPAVYGARSMQIATEMLYLFGAI